MSAADAADARGHPYADACWTYRRAGWRGVLPAHGKIVMFGGYHGYNGRPDPGGADTQAWAEDCPRANVALRLERHIIGLDVDQYDDKRGHDRLQELEAAWGPLPPTWISTSRDDGLSGIRLFTIPTGLAWPGEAAKGIELIHYGERYAIVWPSVHPTSGRTYYWRRPDDTAAVGDVPNLPAQGGSPELPDPHGLPALPARWVAELTGGRAEGDHLSAGFDSDQAALWLAHHTHPGPACGYVTKLRGDATATLAAFTGAGAGGAGALHEAVKPVIMQLVRAAEQGHRDAVSALGHYRDGFLAVAVGRNRRTRRIAEREWAALVDGAINKTAATPTTTILPEDAGSDPCDIEWVPTPADLLAGRRGSTGLKYQRPRPGSSHSPGSPGSLHSPSSAPYQAPRPEVAGSGPDASLGGTTNETTEADEATEAAKAHRQEVFRLLAIEELRREVRKLANEREAAQTFRPPPYTVSLTEEHARPLAPIEWAVEHLLPAGSNALLISQYKTGKTTLLNNLAASLADGNRFLGRFAVPAHYGRIALCNYEVGRDQFQRWTQAIGIQNEAHVTSLNLRGFRVPITSPIGEDWMVRFLEENEITMWIVDPYARATVGSITSENDNAEAGVFLDALDVIKERAGVRDLVLSTHTGRAEMEAGQERARGATRLDDWADARWILTKGKKDGDEHDETRYFSADGRDVGLSESALEFDQQTRSLVMVGGSRATVERDKHRDAIVSILRDQKGLSQNALTGAIRERLGKCDSNAARNAIAKLVADGRVRIEQDGKAQRHHLVDTPDPFRRGDDDDD